MFSRQEFRSFAVRKLADVRAPHLRKRITNAPPILGLMTLATLLAVERSLRGDRARLVSVQALELPGIVMDFGHLHRGSSPFDGRHVRAALRKLGRWPAPMAAILSQGDVRDKVSCVVAIAAGAPAKRSNPPLRFAEMTFPIAGHRQA